MNLLNLDLNYAVWLFCIAYVGITLIHEIYIRMKLRMLAKKREKKQNRGD